MGESGKDGLSRSVTDPSTEAGPGRTMARRRPDTPSAEQEECLRSCWAHSLDETPDTLPLSALYELILSKRSVEHLRTYSALAGGRIARDDRGLCSWERCFLSTRKILEQKVGSPPDWS